MERITSAKNPLIAHLKKLHTDRAYRAQCGQFLCEGRKLLREALQWYPKIDTVVATEGFELPELPPGTRVVTVPESLMERISVMKSPQGVLFTCALPGERPLTVRRGMLLLDRIQDPGNLGTILRTADALDVPVLLTNGCADPFSEKTVRASMGAVLRTPPQSAPMEEILAACRVQGVPLAATALAPDSEDLRRVHMNDYLVVIGSEGQGICQELLDASDKKIIILMQQRCESLNAAVAATIVLWQMRN